MELFGQFSAGPHGGDFHLAGAPPGELRNLPDRVFLQIEEADHDLFPGVEGGDQFVEETRKELPVGVGNSGGVGRAALLDDFDFGFSEIRIRHQGPGTVFAQPVVAGGHCDAGNPVIKGLRPFVLVDLEENLEEDFLGDVVVVSLPPQVVADVGPYGGIEDFHQGPVGRFVTCPDALEELVGDRWRRLFHAVGGQVARGTVRTQFGKGQMGRRVFEILRLGLQGRWTGAFSSTFRKGEIPPF